MEISGSRPQEEVVKKEKNSESRERMIAQLWVNGIDAQNTAAVHGTSIEALQLAIETGNFPGTTDPESGMEMGAFYFMPTKEHFPFTNVQNLDPKILETHMEYDLDDEIWEVCSYAEMSARGHALLAKLNAPLSYSKVEASTVADYQGIIPDDFDLENAMPAIQALYVTEEEIAIAAEEARTRKGIVLGINKDLFDKYPPSWGEYIDFKILTGNDGVDIRYVSGIVGLGAYEQKFFNDLCLKYDIPAPHDIDPYSAQRPTK